MHRVKIEASGRGRIMNRVRVRIRVGVAITDKVSLLVFLLLL